MEKYKKFNKRLLVTLFCLLTIIAIFNIIMDPYNVFMSPDLGFNSLKPEAKRQERLTKIINLKLNKNKIDAVFIGSSRVDWSINAQNYFELTGKHAENMGIVGLNFDEYLNLARLCTKIHPEIKNIYMGLDFYMFNKNHKYNKEHLKFNSNEKLTTQELATVLFAGDTTISSFITLFRNTLSNTDESKLYTRMGTTHLFHNKIINIYFDNCFRQYYEHYDNLVFSYDNYKKIQELQNELKKKNINLIFFYTPEHYTSLNVIWNSGVWNIYENWKRDFAKIAQVWDFDYYNKINDCVVNEDIKYFSDASHASEITGKIMIRNMLGLDNSYGRLNTKQNIDKYLKADTKNLIKWRKNNPKWVKEIDDQHKLYLELKEKGEL